MPNRIAGASDEPFRRKVEACAYKMWEDEGRPHGCDMDHWLRAEVEVAESLKSESTPKAGRSSAVSTTRGAKSRPRKK